MDKAKNYCSVKTKIKHDCRSVVCLHGLKSTLPRPLLQIMHGISHFLKRFRAWKPLIPIICSACKFSHVAAISAA